MNRILLATTCLLAILAVSCDKYEDEQGTGKGSSKVEISITEELGGKTFDHGDVLPLKVTFTGKQQLFGYEIYLINTSAGDTLVSDKTKTKQQVLNVHQSWTNKVSSNANMAFVAVALIDSLGGKEKRQVVFTCKL